MCEHRLLFAVATELVLYQSVKRWMNLLAVCVLSPVDGFGTVASAKTANPCLDLTLHALSIWRLW